MANPLPGDLYVSYPLTNISLAYIQSAGAFIADKVFPNVPVQIQGGKYWRYTQDDWFRIDAKPRGPASESAGGGWRVDTASYFAEVYAIHKDVDDQSRANAVMFNLDRDAARYTAQQLLLQRETKWAGAYFTTGVWGTDLTGVAAAPGASQFLQWDQAAATPIQDIDTYATNMALKIGLRPNVLVLGPQAFASIKNNATIIERIKYTQRGIITEDLLAAMFGVDRVLVPQAIQNTANELATASYSFVYGKSALLAYAAPNPGLEVVSGGYIFSWQGYTGAADNGFRTKKFRMEHLAADRVESEMAYDMEVIAPSAGVFFSSVTS